MYGRNNMSKMVCYTFIQTGFEPNQLVFSVCETNRKPNQLQINNNEQNQKSTKILKKTGSVQWII